MAPPFLPEETLMEMVRARANAKSALEAAKSLGIPRSAFEHRLREAARRGLMGTKPVLPGFQLTQTTTVTDADGKMVREFVQQKPERNGEAEIPAGHVIKGVSIYTDADGKVIGQWTKTREGEIDPLQLAGWLKDAFTGYKPAARPAAKPKAASTDLLTLLPCNDWHIGMFAWGKEVGGENWDLKIAEDVIGRAVEDTVSRSPASAECIVLGGGDLLHADNSENKTAKSGNALQVDGRYQKVVGVAVRLMVRTIDAALRQHDGVTVRILPGNHDEHSAVAIAYFLAAWFRNEPRVNVDLDPSLFFWFRFGQVLLGATHGHTVKLAQIPAIMAHRRAEDWGATKFRYGHGFHVHHRSKIATEGDGVVCETHQAPIPADAWHFGAGYLSGRSLQAITYHRDYGEIGRVRTAILDAGAAA